YTSCTISSPCCSIDATPPPASTLPYSTLFRSRRQRRHQILWPKLRGGRGEPQPAQGRHHFDHRPQRRRQVDADLDGQSADGHGRSEEHTSELQSRENLVCRLLLDKNNQPAASD